MVDKSAVCGGLDWQRWCRPLASTFLGRGMDRVGAA